LDTSEDVLYVVVSIMKHKGSKFRAYWIGGADVCGLVQAWSAMVQRVKAYRGLL
jgi:hypothetical protein